MSEIAIRVEHLSKLYHIGESIRQDSLREALAHGWRAGLGRVTGRGAANGAEGPRAPRPQRGGESFWALKDVSFEVRRGEVVGIIGRNGAGKSTLLKILSRITEPTCGVARIHGRVGSLLEVGTGFHPELTGRENIFLNGAILGMKRVEIARKFDEIVAFAEIERFLDTPVKRYSSGMYVRLAFAVAAHLEPEILLVDEVLAVGDVVFQKKCLGKMGEVAREGRTVLFVSHNMGALLSLCPQAIYLANGAVLRAGPSRQIVAEYLSQAFKHSATALSELRSPGYGTAIRFTEVELLSSRDSKVFFGQPLVYRLRIESKVNADSLRIGSTIFNASGTVVGTLVTHDQFSVAEGQVLDLELSIHDLRLAPGIYYTGFSVGPGGLSEERYEYDIIIGSLLSFQVLPSSDGALSLEGWQPSWGDIVFQCNKLRLRDSEAS